MSFRLGSFVKEAVEEHRVAGGLVDERHRALLVRRGSISEKRERQTFPRLTPKAPREFITPGHPISSQFD